MPEMTEMASNEARLNFREALDTVRAGGRVHITRYNRPEAVLVSPDWYEKAVRALFNAEVNGEDGSE